MGNLKYSKSTVFNVPVQTIVNTVNCFGVMGAGIALEFKLRYPKMYSDYVKRCNNKLVRIGQPYIYNISENKKILNFPTKYHWRNPSKIEWIKQGLEYFVQHYKEWSITSIAFPKLGAGKGGLHWNKVKPLMEQYLSQLDIKVYICLDEAPAEGTEKKMLELLHIENPEILIQKKIINKKQANILSQNYPLNRFSDIMKIKGISKKI